jgi:hypothetical protein
LENSLITLIYLVPRLSQTEKDQVILEAYIRQKDFDLHIYEPGKSFCRVLLALSNLLEGEQKKEVIANALTATRSIGSSWRCYYLIQAAKQLDIAERTPVLKETLQLAKPWDILEICQLKAESTMSQEMEDMIIEDVKYWGWSLRKNLPYYVENIDKQSQYNLWKKSQPHLFSLNRKEMSQRLANSATLLYSLGGKECINEINHSILKVCKWWT